MSETSEETTYDVPADFADEDYRLAVVDLLGVICYGEITAFERLAEDSKLAPTLEDKVALAAMAAGEFTKVGPLQEHIELAGVDPFVAMKPFREAIDQFHRHTAPSNWLEGLVKAFVGDGLANDFYREIAAYLDPATRDLVLSSLEGGAHAEYVVQTVRKAIEENGKVGGPLALWGRRLMGEALTQAQRVAAERDTLTALLTGGVDRPGLDLAAIGRMFTRLTERHAERMGELGLEH